MSQEPQLELIANYKQRLQNTHLKDELYKWEIFSGLKGTIDVAAEDFKENILSIPFSNLIYHLSHGVLRELARNNPEEVREMFVELFDENQELETRIKGFREKSKTLFSALGKTVSHQQDERAISFYLTLQYPEKYTLYKNSFYEKYCKLIGVKEAKKNAKYIHYLGLVNEFVDNYISKDQELLNLIRRFVPEEYNPNNYRLIAQDILYQILDQNPDYLIFQANPDFYKIEEALQANAVRNWTVNAHRDKISIGDKVIIWVTGKKSGCYALAEVTSEPYKGGAENDEFWKVEDTSVWKADIQITHNLVDRPILNSVVRQNPDLVDFKAGTRGTNLQATKKQFDFLLSIAEVSSNFSKARERFSKSDFESYIELLRSFCTDLELDKNDKRVAYTVTDKGLKINIGRRACFAIYYPGSYANYGLITSAPISDKHEKFEGNEPVPYYCFVDDLEIVKQYKEDALNSMRLELNKVASRSNHRRHNDHEFENYVFNTLNHMSTSSNKMDLPLNLILFGPPGTGKTFRLSNEYFRRFTTQKSNVTREDFLREKIEPLSWWRVIAMVLLDMGKASVPEIRNHEFLRIKEGNANTETVPNAIWGNLQSHTVEDCEYVNIKRRLAPLMFSKTKDSKWQVLSKEVEDQAPELIALLEDIRNFSENTADEIKRYEFITFHQSFAYEDFIEGIKPEGEEGELTYPIVDGVFKRICARARKDPDQEYALFIDEINRGNVSQIFGELITLIEADKREGKTNALSTLLPYSKKSFSVPPNLYIIGTMNTADRSVEALDTALRRRFSFVEMSPEPELIRKVGRSDQGTVEGIDLTHLLKTLNRRIEKLLDKDHAIGHSYFLLVASLKDLKSVFQNKIIPLLQEYFYGDFGIIGLVLGSSFVTVQEEEEEEDFFASFDDYDLSTVLSRKIYRLSNPLEMSNMEFLEAISLLLGKAPKVEG